MRALIDLYVQQFKTTLASTLQYRASLVIWMIAHILEPLVYLIVWSAVSETNGGQVGTITTQGFAAYYIILMLVNHVTYTWIMYEYEYRVREGNLSFALLKPVHPIHSDIADNLSSKMITLPMMLAAAAILAWIFRPSASPALWSLAMSVPALVLAFLIRFLVEWALAQSAFWTTRVSAINQAYYVPLLFLSGQIVPLSLFPPSIQILASVLPFRWMIGFPVELLTGQLSPLQGWIGLGAQIVWLALSLALVRTVWRAGVRVYSAVGA
ncbi:MAG: ABC-2 family transporter protein [Anaerolineales bacterium]